MSCKFPPSLANVLLGGFLCLVGLMAGCKKQPYMITIEQTPYLGMPANLDRLSCINVNDVRALEDFNNFIGVLETQPGYKKAIDILRTRIQFDPWQDLDQVLIGTRGKPNPQNPYQNIIVIARGRFQKPEEKLNALRDYLGEEFLIAPPPFTETVHPDTNFKKFSTRAQSQYNEALVFELNFGFPSESLVVFSFSAPLLNEALDVMAGKGPGIGQDQFWQKMLTRVNMGTSLWGAGNIDQEKLTALKDSPLAEYHLDFARQYYYYLNIIQEYRLELGLVCETIDNAVAMSDGLKQGLETLKEATAPMAAMAPELAALPAKIVVLAELETVKITLPLSDAQMKSLLREVRELGGKFKQMPFPGMGVPPAAPGQPQAPMPGLPSAPQPGLPGTPSVPSTPSNPSAPGAVPPAASPAAAASPQAGASTTPTPAAP